MDLGHPYRQGPDHEIAGQTQPQAEQQQLHHHAVAQTQVVPVAGHLADTIHRDAQAHEQNDVIDNRKLEVHRADPTGQQNTGRIGERDDREHDAGHRVQQVQDDVGLQGTHLSQKEAYML